MSKGGSAQAQQPVNPFALGQAQTASNIQTAQTQSGLNNISTFSPFGSSAYQPYYDPVTGGLAGYNLNQQLSPQLQPLFNQQTGLAGNIAGAAGTAVGQGGTLGSLGLGLAQRGAGFGGNVQPTANFANVPTIPTLTPGSFKTDVAGGAGGQPLTPVQTSVNADFPQLVKQAQDAAYQQQTQYLDPQFAQAHQQQEQQLADQGLEPGTEAYDRAKGDLNRQQQMAYQSAQSAAVAAGNAQEQALFGQSLGAGEFANQAQQQMFGQGFQLSNLYNQAVLGAAGQNAQAQAGNLNLAQAEFQDPMTALTTLLGAGTGAYGTGLGGLGAALPAVGAAPTWPISIPTMGGTPATVSPTNLGAITQAATGQNQLANLASRQQLGDIGSLGGSLLTGSGLGGTLFGAGGINQALGLGSGGLVGNLFGAGGLFGPANMGATGIAGDVASSFAAADPAALALALA